MKKNNFAFSLCKWKGAKKNSGKNHVWDNMSFLSNVLKILREKLFKFLCVKVVQEIKY